MILAYPNRVTSGYCTLSGGNWAATMPRDNLLDPVLGVRARTASLATADTQVTAQLSSPWPVRAIALAHHSLSQSAQWRITASSDPGFATLDYDSGWIDVWPILWTDVAWEDAHWWSGTYAQDEIDGYRFTAIHLAPASHTVEYWRVELSDAANGDGFVDIGRLFLGDGWQPVYNFDFGAQLGWQSRSERVEAQSGTRYHTRRAGRRYWTGQLSHMTAAEAYEKAFEIQRVQDLSGECLFVPDPDDTAQLIRRAMLCTLKALTPIGRPYPSDYTMPIQLEEIL